MLWSAPEQLSHVTDPDQITSFNHQNSCWPMPGTRIGTFTIFPVHRMVTNGKTDLVWSGSGMQCSPESLAMVSPNNANRAASLRAN